MRQWAAGCGAFIRRHERMARVVGWGVFLVALVFGGTGCFSCGCSSGSSPIPTASPALSVETGFSRPNADGPILVTHLWDYYYQLPAGLSCTEVFGSLARQGFVAIKVPEADGQGRISRDPAHAPTFIISSGTPQQVALLFDDTYLPVINQLLPIAQGEAAHWETLALPQGQAISCGQTQNAHGEWTYALDYGTAQPEGLPLEFVYCVQGRLSWWPFALSAGPRVLAGATLPLVVDQPPMLEIEGQYMAADKPGRVMSLGFNLVNHSTTRTLTVDLTQSSDIGATWAFKQGGRAVTSVQLGPGGSTWVNIERAIPGDFEGLEMVRVRAQVRDDPQIKASTIFTFAFAKDWSQPFPWKLSFVPLIVR